MPVASPRFISTYSRPGLPKDDNVEKDWKAWMLGVLTVVLSFLAGVFLASFFTEFSFLGSLPYRWLILAGGTSFILWLALISLCGMLIRARYIRLMLILLAAVAFWLPFLLDKTYPLVFISLAAFVTFLGIGLGWWRGKFSSGQSLSSRPFAESSVALRLILLGLAVSVSLLVATAFARFTQDQPPRIFSFFTAGLEQSIKSVGLAISGKETVDNTIAKLLAFFDKNFKSVPNAVKQTLVSSQRELISKMLFSDDKYLSGRERVEEVLWRAAAQSKSGRWAFPVGLFFGLLALSVPLRWVAAALAWILLEIMLSVGFVRLTRELVEREAMILA